MTDTDETNGKSLSDTGTQLFHLADKVIGLIYVVVWMLLIIVVGLLVFYGILITQPQDTVGNAANQLKDLILNVWSQLAPFVTRFASLVAPVFVLLFALGLLHRLGKGGASPFDASKLLSDFPSTLALLIIATICLLPLAGLAVPDVLNNIALVVVGFYFGKRKTSDEG